MWPGGGATWAGWSVESDAFNRFGVRYSETGMLRLIKSLDLSWQKTRPVHPEADRKAQEQAKKACRP